MGSGESFPRPLLLRFAHEMRTFAATRSSWSRPECMGSKGITGIPQQVRRLFGPTGSAGKQDVLFAVDNGGDDSPLVIGDNFDSCVANRKAREKFRDGPKLGVKEEPKPGKERLNSINPTTAQRNRRYLRDSGDPLVPSCPPCATG